MKTIGKQELLDEVEELITNLHVIEGGLTPQLGALLGAINRSAEDDEIEQRYAEWCVAFVKCLEGDQHYKSLDAIKTLRGKGVNYAYVIRRVFEFVYSDLLTDILLESTKNFSGQREQSSSALKKLREQLGELTNSVNAESIIDQDTQATDPQSLREMKFKLLELVNGSIGTLEEIYQYESSNSRAKNLRIVYGIARAIRLNCILPMNEDGKRRWWKELAALSTTAVRIVIEKKWLPTSAKARVYDPDALRVMARELQDEQIMAFASALRSMKPDFFKQVASGAPSEALEGLRERQRFHPSEQASFIIELSKRALDRKG